MCAGECLFMGEKRIAAMTDFDPSLPFDNQFCCAAQQRPDARGNVRLRN
jgi:hypothetical protein